MWETFGTRLSDPLPPDPAHREITGTAGLLPLSIRPRCLLTAGDALVIGHDDGLLALSLTTGTAEGHRHHV
jgi:hypothetical protein